MPNDEMPKNEIERLKKLSEELYRMSTHESERADEYATGSFQRAVHYQASIAYSVAFDMVNQNLNQVIREMEAAIKIALY